MASSAAHNLTFDETNGHAFSSESSQAAASRFQHKLRDYAPMLIAMGGLALFASALVVAFRIVTLDASHQLKQPAIDFAICGAIAFLGLSISWVQLGDRPATEAEQSAADLDVEMEPLPPLARRQVLPQPGMADHACPYCGENMLSLGLARFHCASCGHLQGNFPVSFLDSGCPCPCDSCRQALQPAV